MPAKNHIDLVVKTLNVLEALAQSEHGKALKDIAEEVGLVKSSVFRILFTLKQAGYVEQPETNGVYRLTLKTAGLTRRNSERMGFVTVARPHLIRLRDELDESVALAERRERSVVLIDVLETSHPLRLTFHIGDNCPIHATAMGKAVAAHLSAKELAIFLGDPEMPQYTTRTNTKLRDLKADLGRVQKLGYAVNDEETVSGAVIIGTAIFDSQKNVCGALSVNTPTARCSAVRKKRLIAAVMDVGRRVSSDLSDIGFVR